jgi:hypothetical protein
VSEHAPDERIEEVDEAEGLGCSIGKVLPECGKGGGRGVFELSGSSDSVFGVAIFDRRTGVCSMVSLISSRRRFRTVRFSEGTGRFSIQCMM